MPDFYGGVCVGGPLDRTRRLEPKHRFYVVEIGSMDEIRNGVRTKQSSYEYQYGIWVHETETFESAVAKMARAYAGE